MEKPTTGAVWSEFSDRLRGYIAKHVREETEIPDVLQDVFAKIHVGLGRLRDSEKLEAWLFQVARRAVFDHHRMRSLQRRPAVLAEEVAEKVAEEVTEKAFPTNVSGEVASWLRPMMTLLSEEDQEALRLPDLEGLSRKELASRWGLSVTGAKSRVQRARRRLKEALLQCCHIDLDRRGNAIGYRRKSGSCGSCSCS
ncbi:MAG TPA: RNA polymerase sigma factor SigZ [Planctomycetota bacterium]|nr:RNA polymerase sigma factor SigZ [Planctomycetota bacterium]